MYQIFVSTDLVEGGVQVSGGGGVCLHAEPSQALAELAVLHLSHVLCSRVGATREQT